jgi:hypothetical protein
MLAAPVAYVLMRDPSAFSGVTHYIGETGATSGFSLPLFGAELTAGMAMSRIRQLRPQFEG